MFKYLPSALVGLIAATLFAFNTLFWCVLLIPLSLVKFIIPVVVIRTLISKILVLIASAWIECNSAIMWVTQDIEWDVQGVEGLPADASYLIVCNHRSWTDIFALQHIFKRRIPFLKFFLKQELIWVPILGVAWWALDFPFLKRYSKEFLLKHPQLRGKDLETTRNSCEKFKDMPVSVMNFLEGTRFAKHKHEKQQSPYRHLLMPKAGGVALVMSSMGDYLSNVLDVTIVYPENQPPVNFWDLMAGRIPKIVVRVRVLSIPKDVVGKQYESDELFREQMIAWVNTLWQDKDTLIETLMSDHAKSLG